jgi:hypothetical protein
MTDLTDEEMADALGAAEESRRHSHTMNALLRGQPTPDDDDDDDEQDNDDDHTDEPADFNATIRRAAGRPYNRKTKE